MTMADDKKIHVDLLAIDLEEGHWLKHPTAHLSQETIDAIREKHRDQYYAEKNKNKRPKE